MKTKIIFITTLLFTFLVNNSWSSKIIVAQSGSDYTSIQQGVDVANAGDTILVKTGIYYEMVSFPESGSENNYITLLGEAGAIIDGSEDGVVGITILNKNYIKVIGMEVQNFRITGRGVPIGISVRGNGSYIELRNNTVHHIENINGNAHGIAIYGKEITPISNIIVDGNEIRNCKLGQSESLVLNGNVTNFIVSNNIVHDNDNIGIELASEHEGKSTENIIVRNNFVSGSYQANIMAGGYASNRGNAVNITIVNNTTYMGREGEVALQHNCDSIIIKNNIFYGKSDQSYLQNRGTKNKNIDVNNNIYYGQSPSSPGNWNDANAKYVDPLLINPYTNMHLKAGSPAINAGIDTGKDVNNNPLSGTTDIDNQNRIENGIIDIGADEYIL